MPLHEVVFHSKQKLSSKMKSKSQEFRSQLLVGMGNIPLGLAGWLDFELHAQRWFRDSGGRYKIQEDAVRVC